MTTRRTSCLTIKRKKSSSKVNNSNNPRKVSFSDNNKSSLEYECPRCPLGSSCVCLDARSESLDNNPNAIQVMDKRKNSSKRSVASNGSTTNSRRSSNKPYKILGHHEQIFVLDGDFDEIQEEEKAEEQIFASDFNDSDLSIASSAFIDDDYFFSSNEEDEGTLMDIDEIEQEEEMQATLLASYESLMNTKKQEELSGEQEELLFATKTSDLMTMPSTCATQPIGIQQQQTKVSCTAPFSTSPSMLHLLKESDQGLFKSLEDAGTPSHRDTDNIGWQKNPRHSIVDSEYALHYSPYLHKDGGDVLMMHEVDYFLDADGDVMKVEELDPWNAFCGNDKRRRQRQRSRVQNFRATMPMTIINSNGPRQSSNYSLSKASSPTTSITMGGWPLVDQNNNHFFTSNTIAAATRNKLPSKWSYVRVVQVNSKTTNGENFQQE